MGTVAVVDIDNTCAATNLVLQRLFNIPLDTYPSAPVVKSELFSSNAGKLVFEAAPAVLPVWAFLKCVEAGGVRVVYATGRPRVMEEATKGWLERHGFPRGEVLCGLSAEEKVLLALRERAAFIVDDDPLVLRLAEGCGVRTYAVLWPYNANERTVFLVDWRELAFRKGDSL